LGLNPQLEPTFPNELREPSWEMCQYGVRVYDEFRQQMDTQAGGDPVPHYITEWNSLVGRSSDELSDTAWPCNNYPRGLLRGVIEYVARENLLGFALFVDKDPHGRLPFWVASAVRGHSSIADLEERQRRTLLGWDADVNAVFERGW
jgi:hypothetical protein